MYRLFNHWAAAVVWYRNPMTTTDTRTIPISTRFLIAWVAAIPFCLLQLVFLSDSYNWVEFLFGYMGIVVAAPVVFAGLAVYAFIEYGVRRSANMQRTPFFALVGGVLLLAFFLPATAANPILLNFPQFCRVTQTISWSTSKPKWNGNHRFVLVLIGNGTTDHHRFTTGYLNWTGDEPAGFMSVDFKPVSFQERSYESAQSGTRDYLVSRMSNSGIPEDELTTISNDLWVLLGRVDNGLAVGSTTGVVDDIYCHVDNEWDSYIGGWIWIFGVIMTFQLAGWYTIGRSSVGQAGA